MTKFKILVNGRMNGIPGKFKAGVIYPVDEQTANILRTNTDFAMEIIEPKAEIVKDEIPEKPLTSIENKKRGVIKNG